MKHAYIRFAWTCMLVIFLSGCLFPEEELSKNKTPNEDQLEMVQQAVVNYQEENDGLVPIRTKEDDTPIFRKYLVDFNTLKDNHYLTDIPGNAFENGGIYKYTLITPEDDPQVKLIDLRNTEDLRSVKRKLDTYRSNNTYPPFEKTVEKGVYTLNHEKLGLDSPPEVSSPYSDANLPIVIDTDGELHIDYRPDLMQALEEFDHSYEQGDDIRYILTDNYPFAPAYSLPYTIDEDGEPVFMLEDQ